ERREMSVGADAVQHEVERDALELAVVEVGGPLSAELALDAMDGCGWNAQPVEQRALRHREIRPLVVGRHTALVAPPELGAAPVRAPLGRGVRRPPRARG